MKKTLFLTLIWGLVLCGAAFAEEAIQNGVKKEFYPDGKLKAETTFKDGKKEGTIKMYYENGQLQSEITYNGFEQEGLYKGYYQSGQVQFEVASSKDGKKDGPYKAYYENGQLKSEAIFKDDKKDGPYKEYYENGQLKSEATLKDGNLQEGPYKEYYENGQLKFEGTYKDGKPEGSYKEYHENGQLKSERIFKDGKPEGSYKAYHDTTTADSNKDILEHTEGSKETAGTEKKAIQPRLEQLLEQIRVNTPETIHLTESTAQQGSLTIKGFVTTESGQGTSEINHYLQQIQRLPGIESVQIESIRRSEQNGSPRVQFIFSIFPGKL